MPLSESARVNVGGFGCAIDHDNDITIPTIATNNSLCIFSPSVRRDLRNQCTNLLLFSAESNRSSLRLRQLRRVHQFAEGVEDDLEVTLVFSFEFVEAPREICV